MLTGPDSRKNRFGSGLFPEGFFGLERNGYRSAAALFLVTLEETELRFVSGIPGHVGLEVVIIEFRDIGKIGYGNDADVVFVKRAPDKQFVFNDRAAEVESVVLHFIEPIGLCPDLFQFLRRVVALKAVIHKIVRAVSFPFISAALRNDVHHDTAASNGRVVSTGRDGEFFKRVEIEVRG